MNAVLIVLAVLLVATQLQEARMENARLHAEYDAFLSEHGHDSCAVEVMQLQQLVALLRAELEVAQQARDEWSRCAEHPHADHELVCFECIQSQSLIDK